MSLKKHLLCFCMVSIAGIFIMSCGDDSAKKGNLCGNSECKADQVCKDEVCVSLSDEKCTSTEDICVDESTLKRCKKGEMPVTEKCTSGSCKNGKCETSGEQTDTKCTKNETICVDSITLSECKQGEEAILTDCSKTMDNGVCRSGECVKLAGSEQNCEGGEACPDGMYCGNTDPRTCIAYSKVGESCADNECAPDLLCIEKVCLEPVKMGMACNSHSYCMECDSDFNCQTGQCKDGICQPISDEYGSCKNHEICPEGTICTGGKCIPTRGKCQNNDNCIGDTYCCLDTACGSNKGICVPYSEDKNNDDACLFTSKPGIFEAAIQCGWKNEDDSAGSFAKWVTDMVTVGKFHNTQNIDKPMLAFATTSGVHIVNSETCQTVETIPRATKQSSSPVLADLDGDGFMEIIAIGYYNGMGSSLSIYSWDANQGKHVPKTLDTSILWATNLSIHDIDDDGMPEIINARGQVIRIDGTILSSEDLAPKEYYSWGFVPTVADLNGDGVVELSLGGAIYQWKSGWKKLATIADSIDVSSAYADFGTPGASASQFDYSKLDGKAEIVLTTGSAVQLWSIFNADGTLRSKPEMLMNVNYPLSHTFGYPPAVADLNQDGKPEIGVASRSRFGVYDPKCQKAEEGKCLKKYIAWESPAQDSSGAASAAAFDFDGDEQIEIVYADENYVRVYNGKTGEVLFSSYRRHGTSVEYPTIADVDGDGSTEIVISFWESSALKTVEVDPVYRGVKCVDNEDCYSGKCVGELCRCTEDNQCNWQTYEGELFVQYGCLAPLAGDENGGNVCRAVQGKHNEGIIVLRDRLDRWVSSRSVYNQHAYAITNINDDGTIPKTSDWKQNFLVPGYNNFHQQPTTSKSNQAPDITGRFTSAANACKGVGDHIQLTAQVCNRGTKTVGSRMPAVFYKNSIDAGNILCVSYTDEMVPVKGCRNVSCDVPKDVAQSLVDEKIILKVNDDGKGGRTTVECNTLNNTDEITISSCQIN